MMAMVDAVIFMGWFNGAFGVEFPIYMGSLMNLITCLASSAYVAVKTIDAAIDLDLAGSIYSKYASFSDDGDLLGVWEIIFVIMFLSWSLIVTGLSYFTAVDVINYTGARELAVYTEGTLGVVATPMDAMKIFALLTVMGMGTWLSAQTLGDSADELLSWFNNYKTSIEGWEDLDRRPRRRETDEPGTAIGFDLIYHSATTVYSYLVLSAMLVGGYVFAFSFLGFGRAPADCDPANVDGVDYGSALNAITNLSEGTYDECIEAMDKAFHVIDINKDSYMDKCESAKFLKAYGNTDEYSLEYAGMATAEELHKYCMWVVPDAFDHMHGDKMDMMSEIMDMWPFSMIKKMMMMMMGDQMMDMHDAHHEEMDMMDMDGHHHE